MAECPFKLKESWKNGSYTNYRYRQCDKENCEAWHPFLHYDKDQDQIVTVGPGCRLMQGGI